jgi:hypothetical protein
LTPAELADEIDTSVQNIHYHLGKLEGADLVDSIDTAYSSRGVEMDVYAPTNEAIVLLTGRPSRSEQIRSLLQRFLGGIAFVAVASFIIHSLSRLPERNGTPGGTPTATPEESVGAASNISSISPTPTETPTPVGTDLVSVASYSPGIFVFAGGFLVLVLAVYWMYRDLPEK